MDYNAFAEKVKLKYPDYQGIDNKTLAERMIAKYPDYKSQVEFGQTSGQRLAEMPAPTFKEKAYQAIEGAGEISKAGWRDVGNMITFPAKAGFATGREIARIADQERSVVVPGNDLRVAKEAMIDTGKQLAQGVAYPYMHPIQSFKEQPITTTLAWSPLALAAEKKLGLTPATRPVKVAAKAAKLDEKATATYRKMLRPTQGEVKKIEIRQGKNIDDFYKLAAEEKLPIGKTSDNKLDTAKAREILHKKVTEINDNLNAKLADHQGTFNLKNIANKAKGEVDRTIKNATEANKMKASIDEYITDEITKNKGRAVVTTAQLNDIKQGMWSVGYDAMKPTSATAARKIGYVAREAIEKAVADVPMKTLNAQSGKYQTLIDLLDNADGRVIQGGKLGQYFGRTIGTGIGGTAGYAVGGPAGSVIGSGIGAYAGGEAVAAFNSPSRMSRIGATAMEQSNKLKLMNSPTDRMIRGIDRLPQRIPPAPSLKGNQTGAIGKVGDIPTYAQAQKLIPKEGGYANAHSLPALNRMAADQIGQSMGFNPKYLYEQATKKGISLQSEMLKMDSFGNGEARLNYGMEILEKLK
jgi:hypothetical protein